MKFNITLLFALVVLNLACEKDNMDPIVNRANDRWILTSLTGGFAGLDEHYDETTTPEYFIFNQDGTFEKVSTSAQNCSTTGSYEKSDNPLWDYELTYDTILTNCQVPFYYPQFFKIENDLLVADEQVVDGFRFEYEKVSR